MKSYSKERKEIRFSLRLRLPASENFEKDWKMFSLAGICQLAPEFMSGKETYVSFASRNDATRLIELYKPDLHDSLNMISQTVQSGGHYPIDDINLGFFIDNETGCISVLTLQRAGMNEPDDVYHDDAYDRKLESELGKFLSDWLDDIKQTGFERMEQEHAGEIGMDISGPF